MEESWNSHRLYTIPAEGGEPQPVMDGDQPALAWLPDWSPDGAHIAYFGMDNTLRVIPAVGGASRVLVSDLEGKLRGQGLTWSPDGSAIAYTAGGRVWKVGREGGEPTGLQADPHQIDWSPDGQRLVFNVYMGGISELELWLMEDFSTLPGT